MSKILVFGSLAVFRSYTNRQGFEIVLHSHWDRVVFHTYRPSLGKFSRRLLDSETCYRDPEDLGVFPSLPETDHRFELKTQYEYSKTDT
jgi:hypothetical protein